MIKRALAAVLRTRVLQTPVVALLGSRQVGKTTLARSLEIGKPIQYLDLERPSDIAKLADPELYLGKFADHLVILDEIQRLPDLFPVLRSLVDERRRAGEAFGQFLILGSASPELLRQSSETLTGRISYLELYPFNLTELKSRDEEMDRLWFRGGYPDSFLATDDSASRQWCEDFISSYVERYLPQLGINAAPLLLRRLCSMVAHQQGATLNLSRMAGSLGIDGKTVRHYLDLLEGLYLVRSIPAWSRNAGKRLVKSPKVYWRDSGLLHSLTGIDDLEHLLGNPLCGHSWEGYCLEQIIPLLPKGTNFSHYRTQAGAEIDLVLESSSGEVIAIEIKRTLSPKLSPAFLESAKTLQATRGYFLTPGGDSYLLSESVTAISLPEFLSQLPHLCDSPR
jgi:predicted AAA+ superfamily ATPase